MDSQNQKITLKILVIGDFAPGKTSFLNRLCDNTFTECTIGTVGLEYRVKDYIIDDKEINAILLDSAGQESYYPFLDGFLIFYDITNIYTFKSKDHWISDIQQNFENTKPIVLVGMKNDLEEQRAVSKREAKRFSLLTGHILFECSAKTGKNINEPVIELIEEILQKRKVIPKVKSNKKIKVNEKLNNAKEKPNSIQINENYRLFDDNDDKFFNYQKKLFRFNFNSFIYHSKYLKKKTGKIE